MNESLWNTRGMIRITETELFGEGPVPVPIFSPEIHVDWPGIEPVYPQPYLHTLRNCFLCLLLNIMATRTDEKFLKQKPQQNNSAQKENFLNNFAAKVFCLLKQWPPKLVPTIQ